MAKQTKTTKEEGIVALPIHGGAVTFNILGTTPLVYNRLGHGGQTELLFPQGGRKTQAARAGKLKHDVLQEYVDSVHRNRANDAPTYLKFRSAAFRGAIATAALVSPDMFKSQVGMLVWVKNDWTDIYGVPQLMIAQVRNSGSNRTPDMRTRAVLPRWACQITVEFAQPLMKAIGVARLLATGGIVCGIGDGRQEKGKLSYGQFVFVQPGDAAYKEFQEIMRNGGRKPQYDALHTLDPCCYDEDTDELFHWFVDEYKRRYGVDYQPGANHTPLPQTKSTITRSRRVPNGNGRMHPNG